MSTLARDLDAQLSEMDPEAARHVEGLIREALALAARKAVATDAMGYPAGYFDSTAGSFANEPLDRPQSTCA